MSHVRGKGGIVAVCLLAVAFVLVMGMGGMSIGMLLGIAGFALGAVVGRIAWGAHRWIAASGVTLCLIPSALMLADGKDPNDAWWALAFAVVTIAAGMVAAGWCLGVWAGLSWRRKGVPSAPGQRRG